MAEVEVFSPRKLQRALTFTDAEIENEEVVSNLGNWNVASYFKPGNFFNHEHVSLV